MAAKKTIVATLVAMVMTIALGASAAAQSTASGKLNVTFTTSSLDSLILYSARCNNNQSSLEGFRIQIYSGSGITSKNDASEAQAKFLKMYPEEKAYIIYNAPFWRVRVGDYRSRSEALILLNKLQSSFGGSYIVRDNTVKKHTFRE